MIVLPSSSPIDLASPVNWTHPLARGCIARWICVPGIGGAQWYDLTRRLPAKLTTISGTTPFTGSNRPGSVGGQFLGNGSVYADAGTDTQLVNLPFGSFAVWIQPTSTTRIDFFSHTDAASNQAWRLIWSLTTSKFTWQVSNTGSVAVTATSGNTYPTGAWHRVVGTHDGATGRIYVNGKLDGTVALAGPLYTGGTSVPTRLGLGTGSPLTAGSSADDFTIWNYPLSAAEVQLDYLESSQGYPRLLNRGTRWLYAATSLSKSVTDSCVARDLDPIDPNSLVIAVSTALAESCGGADAMGAVSASLSVTDSAAAVDLLTQLTAAIGAITDGCAAVEVLAAGVLISITDSSTGVDGAPTMTATLTIPETCTGTDLINALAVILSVLDSASSIDAVTVNTGAGGMRVVTITFTPTAKTLGFAAAQKSISFSLN